ncbi:unnamed protein product [marine sediment metagenome]|uniref:Uncharacterized protein n=1 Tax=marine sediment metagenome TaxID=412755 RepID=X1DXX4_9ZZZZ
MSEKVTVTDTTDVAMMKINDIRTWISLHKRALKDSNMEEHWEDIQNDLGVLQDEFDLRNPLIASLKEMNVHLGSIENHLRLLVQIKEKEKEDGKAKT